MRDNEALQLVVLTLALIGGVFLLFTIMAWLWKVLGL
jgi:hypothetical protein